VQSSPFLTYEEALGKLLSEIRQPSSEVLPLDQCVGRVLASDVSADQDLPPFDKAVMDGYALRSEDVAGAPASLMVVGEMSAGTARQIRVGKGEAAKVMTGAPIPPGANAVQVVEETWADGPERVKILRGISRGGHIAPKGSEVRKGQTVLCHGEAITPSRIGVLAAFGQSKVTVFRAPSVAVISTGSELVGVDEKPGFGQIRNSNAEMLRAQCASMLVDVSVLPAIRDDPDRTSAVLDEAAGRDVLVFSGGVSMGEHDYVHKVLSDQDEVRVVFHKVALKPGKPVFFARRGDQLIFGLPGNPVSSFVTFELFVRPAIRKRMGFRRPGLVAGRARLEQDLTCRGKRKLFIPARAELAGSQLCAVPVRTEGSADLTAFSAANALVAVPGEVPFRAAGEMVDVVLLEAFWLEGGGFGVLTH
jgi:molybdopterin molybdotransferase